MSVAVRQCALSLKTNLFGLAVCSSTYPKKQTVGLFSSSGSLTAVMYDDVTNMLEVAAEKKKM